MCAPFTAGPRHRSGSRTPLTLQASYATGALSLPRGARRSVYCSVLVARGPNCQEAAGMECRGMVLPLFHVLVLYAVSVAVYRRGSPGSVALGKMRRWSV